MRKLTSVAKKTRTVGVEAVDGVLFGATENTLEQPDVSWHHSARLQTILTLLSIRSGSTVDATPKGVYKRNFSHFHSLPSLSLSLSSFVSICDFRALLSFESCTGLAIRVCVTFFFESPSTSLFFLSLPLSRLVGSCLDSLFDPFHSATKSSRDGKGLSFSPFERRVR